MDANAPEVTPHQAIKVRLNPEGRTELVDFFENNLIQSIPKTMAGALAEIANRHQLIRRQVTSLFQRWKRAKNHQNALHTPHLLGELLAKLGNTVTFVTTVWDTLLVTLFVTLRPHVRAQLEGWRDDATIHNFIFTLASEMISVFCANFPTTLEEIENKRRSFRRGLDAIFPEKLESWLALLQQNQISTSHWRTLEKFVHPRKPLAVLNRMFFRTLFETVNGCCQDLINAPTAISIQSECLVDQARSIPLSAKEVVYYISGYLLSKLWGLLVKAGSDREAEPMRTFLDHHRIDWSCASRLCLPIRRVDKKQAVGKLIYSSQVFYHFISVIEVGYSRVMTLENLRTHPENLAEIAHDQIRSHSDVLAAWGDCFVDLDIPSLTQTKLFDQFTKRYLRLRGRDFVFQLLGTMRRTTDTNSLRAQLAATNGAQKRSQKDAVVKAVKALEDEARGVTPCDEEVDSLDDLQEEDFFALHDELHEADEETEKEARSTRDAPSCSQL